MASYDNKITNSKETSQTTLAGYLLQSLSFFMFGEDLDNWHKARLDSYFGLMWL